MPLIGALSNHADKLARLTDLRARLLSQADYPDQAAVPIRLRCGAIQSAVIEALAIASAPMSVQEVHAAVERHLNMRVSIDSVNSCLSTGARSPNRVFERVRRGCYQLLGASP